MATFYIPYVVGSSALAYLGKEMASYLFKDDKELEDISKNNNEYLKNEKIEYDIIENETDNEKKGEVIDDCIDREYRIELEPDDSIPFPEHQYLSPPENKSKKVTFEEKYNEPLKPKPQNMNFNNSLETIKEEKETSDSMDLRREIILPTNLHKCSKCNIFLPPKCFSKTQKKKTPKVWKCKICLKLN